MRWKERMNYGQLSSNFLMYIPDVVCMLWRYIFAKAPSDWFDKELKGQ